MDFDFKVLARGENWSVEWKRFQREEWISLNFDNDTVVDVEVLDAVHKHGAWYLFCRGNLNVWDLSPDDPLMVGYAECQFASTCLPHGIVSKRNRKRPMVSGTSVTLKWSEMSAICWDHS